MDRPDEAFVILERLMVQHGGVDQRWVKEIRAYIECLEAGPREMVAGDVPASWEWSSRFTKAGPVWRTTPIRASSLDMDRIVMARPKPAADPTQSV